MNDIESMRAAVTDAERAALTAWQVFAAAQPGAAAAEVMVQARSALAVQTRQEFDVPAFRAAAETVASEVESEVGQELRHIDDVSILAGFSASQVHSRLFSALKVLTRLMAANGFDLGDDAAMRGSANWTFYREARPGAGLGRRGEAKFALAPEYEVYMTAVNRLNFLRQQLVGAENEDVRERNTDAWDALG